ncbi:hypothetical protein BHE74_00034810 [Ensete ventricosum]|nr:hypothetical protein BHE74_00034810 [Ensete ventricosum]RZS15502.1 hypothetical protein BHM03_00047344 [Ensete ventricosum]
MFRFFNRFNHQEPPLLAAIVAAPEHVAIPTQAFRGSIARVFPCQFLWLGGSSGSRWGRRPVSCLVRKSFKSGLMDGSNIDHRSLRGLMIAKVSLRARNPLAHGGSGGSSLRIGRWVRVAVDGSNRFGRDRYGCNKRYRKVVLAEFCIDRLRFGLLLGLLFEGDVEVVKRVRWQCPEAWKEGLGLLLMVATGSADDGSAARGEDGGVGTRSAIVGIALDDGGTDGGSDEGGRITRCQERCSGTRW